MFSNIGIIYKRELKGYFYTPLAYIFIGMFSLLMGWMFSSFLAAYFKLTFGNQFGMGPTITIDRLSEAFYANMHVILMLVLPFLTMRLFTEEARQNTITLLMTSPIRMWELTIAKFLAAGTILFLLLAVTGVLPAFLFLYGGTGGGAGPDGGVVLTTYLGLLLVGLSYVGFGLFWSSVTESQLVAVLMTFTTCFSFWLLSMAAQSGDGTSTLGDILKYMAINEQFQNFTKGILETQSLVYFGSLVFLSLYLTVRSLESRSWRS